MGVVEHQFLGVVEFLGIGDSSEHHALNGGARAGGDAVACILGCVGRTVAAPVFHVTVFVVAHKNHAVAVLLLVIFVCVNANHGAAVAAF